MSVGGLHDVPPSFLVANYLAVKGSRDGRRHKHAAAGKTLTCRWIITPASAGFIKRCSRRELEAAIIEQPDRCCRSFML
jgi:hypothetical protein